MEWGSDLLANKQTTLLAILINISFYDNIEWWKFPWNMHRMCDCQIETNSDSIRLFQPFSSKNGTKRTSNNNWNFNFAWISMTYQITNCEKSPALFFPAGVSNFVTWMCLVCVQCTYYSTEYAKYTYVCVFIRQLWSVLDFVEIEWYKCRWVKEMPTKRNEKYEK